MYVVAPGQAVANPESCHRQRVSVIIVVERADDSIAARA